jgi:hypothetical protein
MSQSSFADAEYAGKRKKTQPPDGSIPMGDPNQTLRHRAFPFWELRKPTNAGRCPRSWAPSLRLILRKPRRTLGRYKKPSKGSLASATVCMSWEGWPSYWLVVAAHPQS